MFRFPLILAATLALSCGVAQAATPTSDGSVPATAAVVQKVTHVPATALNTVGAGTVLPQSLFSITKLTGSPLKVAGKPDLLTLIEAWCPHCAADSWGIAIALSRFGTLSGLRFIDSGTYYGTVRHGNPAYPHTKGLSFFGAKYTSSLLSFNPVIEATRAGTPFQTPTAAQESAIQVFNPDFIIPTMDIGGVFGLNAAPYYPNLFGGMTWAQIAGVLATPTSPLAKEIDGYANLLSAAICRATGNKPTAVCTSAAVTKAKGRLPS